MLQKLIKKGWSKMVVLAISVIFLLPMVVNAQDDPGYCPDCPEGDHPPVDVPISSSMTLYFALISVLFAIWIIKKRSNKGINTL